MIEVQGLSKHFGPVEAVRDVSFEVRRGEVLGFLGPNGAGKSTTMRILVGYIPPSGGRAIVAGHDVVAESLEVRRKIGYLPENAPLYTDMRVDEFVSMIAEVRGIPTSQRRGRIDATIAICGLGDALRRNVGELSKGYRQRVGLAAALVHEPDVMILDEPTSGLDPLAQRTVLDLLRAEAQSGRTVFFSSHVLSEAEQICDRVAILREGRLAVLDRVETLRSRKYKEVTLVHAGPPPNLEGIEDVEVVWRRNDRMTFRVRGDLTVLLSRLAACSVQDISIEEPSLEEVFLDFYRGEAA